MPSVELAALAGTDRSRLGEAILRMIFGVWERPDARRAWLGLLRSAVTDPGAARMLREFLAGTVIEPLAARLDGPDADRRVALVASQILGLGMARYAIELEPLATAGADDLVALLAPALQRLLTDGV